MKKHVTVCSVFLGIAFSLAALGSCSSGSGGGDDDGPSSTTYAITIVPTGATGSEAVTASVTTAEAGTTVTLTATLGSGRRVALNAAGVSIRSSTISANGGTATFTMPAKAIEVRAYVFTATTQRAGAVTFNMHYVPSGGTFIMGEHVETVTQTVTLTRNFWMGETEVTQGLWEEVWGTTWPGSPGSVPDDHHGLGVNYPAYYVNWYDAVAFCNLLTVADGNIADTERVYYSDAGFTTAYTVPDAASNVPVYVDWSKKGYRLPTEAEWEYAARYIDGTRWNRGDHVSGGPVYTDETDPDKIGDYAWYYQNSSPAGSKEVGQKLPNALGLRDMSGNVWEYCYDRYADYGGTAVNDPTGPASGSNRVVRGDSYANLSGSELPCANRLSAIPTYRYYDQGFRLCRTAN